MINPLMIPIGDAYIPALPNTILYIIEYIFSNIIPIISPSIS